jgi:hypothetical protein
MSATSGSITTWLCFRHSTCKRSDITWKHRSTTENMLVGSTTSFALGMLTAIHMSCAHSEDGMRWHFHADEPVNQVPILISQGHEQTGK